MNISITALAADPGGAVSKVEFYADGAKLGEAASSPYTFIWNNAPAGSHVLTVRAIDNQAVARISAPIWVVVTFVLSGFAAELNSVDFLGFPLGFYMAAQGSLFIYLALIWYYNWRMRQLDAEYGIDETGEGA